MPTRPILGGLAALLFVVAGALLLGPLDARSAGSWAWPVEGEVLTGYRNGDDPYAGGQHRGIDIAAPVGTPVTAATAGSVRFAGVAGSNGLTVSIRTSDGSFDTSYLHLVSAEVRKGDSVTAGERIGGVGTSGRRSADAAHLHFGVREAGSRHAYVDPLRFLPPLGAPRVPKPHGAPAPVEAPVPVAPAPAPVRAPAPAPAPVRAPVPAPTPAPVRAPAPAPVRAPLPARVRTPVSEPGSAPVPARVSEPLARPLHAPEPGPVPVPGEPVSAGRPAALANVPSLGPGRTAVESEPVTRLAPDTSPRLPEPSAAAPAVGGSSAGGPDLGWALACVGLLLAALCLGRPGGGRSEERPRATGLRALLKPLTGRR